MFVCGIVDVSFIIVDQMKQFCFWSINDENVF